MSAPPAGIPEADWLATPVSIQSCILAQHQESQALRKKNEELRIQLTTLATELSQLRDLLGRSSRNSSKPPSNDGPGFKPPDRRKGSGRKRDSQPGHPGSGPELLPIERVDEVVEHHPDTCRRCGTLLQGEDSDPLRHQVIEISPITPLVIEHRLHRLVCPCCTTSTCASLPADGEASQYGPRLSALVRQGCLKVPDCLHSSPLQLTDEQDRTSPLPISLRLITYQNHWKIQLSGSPAWWGCWAVPSR